MSQRVPDMENDSNDKFFNFLSLFKHLPEVEREVITKHFQLRKVTEGAILLEQGKLARELFFIGSGILKIVSLNEKGNNIVQFFLKENQFCTILNSFNNSVPAHESIVAACDAELIVFAKDKMTVLYEKIPYFKDLIDQITKQALLDKIQMRNSYMGEDATARYKKFLVQQPDIAISVSLSDTASYLGITQQSLSRIRKQLSVFTKW